MTGAILSRVRLFPLLIAVACLALGMRVLDIYSGFEVLNSPVVAADQDEDPADAAAEQTAENDKKQEADNTDAAALQPLDPASLGLPSRTEITLNSQLRARRIQLDERATQLDLQERLLEANEKRIDDKIMQLQQLEASIKASLRIFNEREEKEFAKVVKIYETMKPKAAAPIFENLPGEVQLDIATRMKEAKFALILAAMDPAKARDLTTNLAEFAQPPSIEDLDVAGR
jgi:flagellar motility protein MotE (MotC chaperone)